MLKLGDLVYRVGLEKHGRWMNPVIKKYQLVESKSKRKEWMWKNIGKVGNANIKNMEKYGQPEKGSLHNVYPYYCLQKINKLPITEASIKICEKCNYYEEGVYEEKCPYYHEHLILSDNPDITKAL